MMKTLTVEQYVDVFTALLKKRGVKLEAGFKMLKAHYYEPGRLISAEKLAKAAGKNSYSTGNEWYGSFSKKVAEWLNFEPAANESGVLRWTYTLCDASDSQDENGHFQWFLKQEVANALENLGLVQKRYYADSVTDLEQKKEIILGLTGKYRDRYIKARIGQGQYRRWVISHWGCCAVTGCSNTDLLIASHIKPWRDCEINEAIDPMNSLLLIPNYDVLFDRGFITFDDSGIIILSPYFDEQTAKEFSVSQDAKLSSVSYKNLPYLAYHRAHVFRSQK
ncbi:HNH endonuclease [Shewanella oncorhynchi]